jgi:aspartate kinase
MALIVQKYGGTSVANSDRIKNVAARVAKYRANGDQIVVVVSAMSGVTDNLIKLAKEIMPLPSEREMDMLLATEVPPYFWTMSAMGFCCAGIFS